MRLQLLLFCIHAGANGEGRRADPHLFYFNVRAIFYGPSHLVFISFRFQMDAFCSDALFASPHILLVCKMNKHKFLQKISYEFLTKWPRVVLRWFLSLCEILALLIVLVDFKFRQIRSVLLLLLGAHTRLVVCEVIFHVSFCKSLFREWGWEHSWSLWWQTASW